MKVLKQAKKFSSEKETQVKFDIESKNKMSPTQDKEFYPGKSTIFIL